MKLDVTDKELFILILTKADITFGEVTSARGRSILSVPCFWLGDRGEDDDELNTPEVILFFNSDEKFLSVGVDDLAPDEDDDCPLCEGVAEKPTNTQPKDGSLDALNASDISSFLQRAIKADQEKKKKPDVKP
jgi:hypothetical protein